MRAILGLTLTLSISLLTACQHFDPWDTVRQEKTLNIAIINSETYALIPNAHCTIITDSHDDVNTQRNPDAIRLPADYKTLSLDCNAPDYTQTAIAITNTINHWSAADLFMLPPGDIVDTRSHLLPYYPSRILVLMSKKPFVTPDIIKKQFEQDKAKNILYQGTA